MLHPTDGELYAARRRAVKHPSVRGYYANFDQVEHNRAFADGERIFIYSGVGTTYNEFSFHRTEEKAPGGGDWVATGGVVDLSAPANW